MTQPVILYGTQENGETLPVQVDATGRLVAEGLKGEDGAGVPWPYGDEGSYLRIYNGEPTWMDGDISAPEPPALVKLIDTSGHWGASIPFNSAGNDSSPRDDLDEWLREESCWENPEELTKHGLGQEMTALSPPAQSSFRVTKAAGKVLTLFITSQCWSVQNNGNIPCWHRISSTSDKISMINDASDRSIYLGTMSPVTYSDVFSLLINDDDFEFNILHDIMTDRVSTSYPKWSVIKKYELTDQTTFLMNEYSRLRNNYEKARSELRELKDAFRS